MAKRINTKFLILLTGAVGALVLIVGGVLLRQRLASHDPQKFIADGEREFLAGRIDNALTDYGKAIHLQQGRPELLVRYGELLQYKIGEDRKALNGARSAWQAALVTDPNNVAALRHLMESYIEEMQVRPSPAVFPRLSEFAGKLATVDPTDSRAKAYQHIATILQSASGVATPPAAVAEAMKDLEAQAKLNPGDSDLLYYLSRGKIHEAQKLQQDGDPDSANAVMASLRHVTDEAVSAQPQNASIQWRASMIYAGLAAIDKPNKAALDAQANAAIAAAHANVKPADVHFNDIEGAMASLLFQQRKNVEGAALLRSIYAQNPNDAAARLQLARYLRSQPATRQEAIDLLSKPFIATDQKGLRASFYAQYDAERLYELTLARIDAYIASDDPARRKVLMDDLQVSYRTLTNAIGVESVPALRLLGTIQQLQGQNVEAVATYHRGLSALQRSGQVDYDLVLRAGRLDMMLGQNGSAEKLFSQYASVFHDAIPPRLDLVSMYLADANFDDAKRVLGELEALAPAAPEVISLRIQELIAEKNPAAAKPYYARLTEKTTQERRLKAQAALRLKDSSEAIRLLELLRAESPGEVRVALSLSQAYAQAGEKPKAAAVIDDTLKLKPADPSLLVMQKQLQNATPKELQALVEQLQTSNGDEFSHEMQGFQFAIGKDNFGEAATHLATANNLKPDNVLVHESYFQLYLAQRKFDKAAAEIPALSRLNADEANGLIFRTRLATAQQNFNEAIQDAHDLVDHRPDFAESYIVLAGALAQGGKLEDALKEYRHALDHQSNNFEALRGAAETALALQQPDKANDYITKGARLFPNNTVFRELSLNYDLIYSGHPQTVIDARTSLLAASPNDPSAYAALAQAAMRVAQINKTADPLKFKQMSDIARDTLQKGVAKWPDDARFASALAQVLQEGGDEAKGEKILTDFAARPAQKNNIQAWRNLADFYARTNQRDKYDAALRAAIPLSDQNIDLRQKLAASLAQVGKTDEALATLKDIVNQPLVVQQRIQIQMGAHRTADAEKSLKDALVLTPRSPELLNMLTLLYVDAGRFDDARSAAKNAVAANPKDDLSLYYQAVAELRRPDPDLQLALANLTTLKARAPDNISSRLLLAEADRRSQRPDDAVRELEDAVQLAPSNREARLLLLSAYASATPPSWDRFDKLVASAISNPQLKGDPVWLQQQASGLSARHQYAAAVDKLRAALQIAPASPTLEFDLLLAMIDAKDYPAATHEADRVLANDSKPWWALYSRGIARSAAADKKGGLADLDAALAGANAGKDQAAAHRVIAAIANYIGAAEAMQRIQAQGAGVEWRLTAIEMYAETRDYAAAIKAAQALYDDSAASLTPVQKALALRLMAESYQAEKDFVAAKAAYQKLLELTPDNIPALNNLAFMLADDMQDPSSAKPYIQHAYQLAGKTAGMQTIADTYGWVMTLAGGPDARIGLNVLTALVDSNPTFLDARYHLGEALRRGNEPDQACAQFQAGLDQINTEQRAQPAYRSDLKAALSSSLAKAKLAAGR